MMKHEAPQSLSNDLNRIEAETRQTFFAHITPETMQVLLDNLGMTDWHGFAESWERLGMDLYMADGGRYRRRRYASFALSDDTITRKKHQPHYQSRDYNALNGGIERWFEPIEDAIADHPVMHAVLSLVHRLAVDLTSNDQRPDTWHAEVHQFRIEAQPGKLGQPTPEGRHRDGVDWVLVLMVRRENVNSGETTIYDLQGREIGGFTLSAPMDAAFVNDNQAYHGVTPIHPVDNNKPAFRDVLVVTLRHQ
ncbi:2OG-Fe dioxygenase family protein [Acetobacter sp.]|uniref:2OG-Fe dioxygenase family protein n=1 Tax=Acetobacter sp. TaxID=440 RepID=UPI0039EBA0E6